MSLLTRGGVTSELPNVDPNAGYAQCHTLRETRIHEGATAVGDFGTIVAADLGIL